MLEAAVQPKTSGVIAPWKSLAMYSTAATVSGELMTTFSFSSWIEPPKAQIIAWAAMLESISLDMPMPIWTPCSLLMRTPPSSSSSKVVRAVGQVDLLPRGILR